MDYFEPIPIRDQRQEFYDDFSTTKTVKVAGTIAQYATADIVCLILPALTDLTEQVRLPEGFRGTVVACDYSNFSGYVDSPLKGRRTLFFIYKDNKNFNIEPPRLPPVQPFVWDALAKCKEFKHPEARCCGGCC